VEAFVKNSFKKAGRETICRDCQRKYLRGYYLAHKEKAAEWQHKYYQDNKAWIAKRDHEYYLDNKDRIASRNKDYVNKHRARIDDYQRKYRTTYYQANKWKINERNRRNSKTETGKISIAIANHKRRIKKCAVGGSYTKQQWVDLIARQKNRCYYEKHAWAIGCKGKFTEKNKPTVDHIVAISNVMVGQIA
jgi:hypothetical protein